jgi:ribosomal protein L11 methyltransferase
MAFGTGGHPSTRLCLAALEDAVKPGSIVADIGTGSGILAIAAAHLGAARVHATDIDSLPRRIARENVTRSHLESIVAVHEMDSFDAAARGCDVVVANIVADTVIELTPAIFQRLKPLGLFIASGIVEERLPDVDQALRGAGFALLNTLQEEIWRCAVAQRPAAQPSTA